MTDIRTPAIANRSLPARLLPTAGAPPFPADMRFGGAILIGLSQCLALISKYRAPASR